MITVCINNLTSWFKQYDIISNNKLFDEHRYHQFMVFGYYIHMSHNNTTKYIKFKYHILI